MLIQSNERSQGKLIFLLFTLIKLPRQFTPNTCPVQICFFLTQWFENDQEYVKFLSKQICWRYQPIWNCNPSNFLLSIWYADTFTGFWQLDNIYKKQSAIVSWPLQKNLKSLKFLFFKQNLAATYEPRS